MPGRRCFVTALRLLALAAAFVFAFLEAPAAPSAAFFRRRDEPGFGPGRLATRDTHATPRRSHLEHGCRCGRSHRSLAAWQTTHDMG